MANVLITPNMQLPNPVPGVDPGPDYANNLSSSLNIIDQHNHSAGNGVLISPNGMNINADLPFNDNNATLLRSARFSVQPNPLSLGTDLGCLYVSGVDLYYNDVNGNQIQLTVSGAVNATSSGIVSGTASAAFSGGVLVVKSSSTSGANVLLGSVELTNSGNLTNILTLQPPILSGSSTQTLPTTPAATSFMQMDSSGNMSASVAVAGGIGTSNIADGSITNPKLAALNIQQSASSGSFTGSATSATAVTGLSVTITTSGRPVMILLQPYPGASQAWMGTVGTFSGVLQLEVYLYNGSSYLFSAAKVESTSAGSAIPPLLNYIDTPAAGTITYSIQYAVASNTYLGAFTNCQLVAYEI